MHIIESSGTIDVALNSSTGELELCLASLPRGCFSTTTFNFTVTDITGYPVSIAENIPDGECTPIDVPQVNNTKCAPFDIAIDAYNPLVTYQTVYRTVGQGELIKHINL
ncbi:MAG: hypothetical protein MJE68_03815 [Proteobacteria bacterium]|nr:hypothetical protein [Pseudomonadota bacterium]